MEVWKIIELEYFDIVSILWRKFTICAIFFVPRIAVAQSSAASTYLGEPLNWQEEGDN